MNPLVVFRLNNISHKKKVLKEKNKIFKLVISVFDGNGFEE